jgi:acetylornithine deacetylase
MKFAVDRDYILEVLTELVRTDSRNPGLVEDGPGEEEIAGLVAGYLADLGLSTTVHRMAPDRVNVLGVLAGSGGGRSLMLNGHTDTVGVEGMAEPFSASVRDGKLYGRGAQDMKGSLAAMLGAVKTLVDSGVRLQGNLLYAAVADEEHRSLGTRHLVQRYRADGAVVTEPTEMQVVTAHRGMLWYEVETLGRAAHGSRYQEGIDAITHMGRFLKQLDRLQEELRTREPHPLVGRPSLHASRIEGGTDWSTYPAGCRLRLERRSVPGETAAANTAELETILTTLSVQDPDFNARLRQLLVREPLETSPDSELVRSIQGAFSEQLNRSAELTGASYWSDAALLAEAGMDAVLLGPVGGGLHAREEWVELDSVYALAGVLASTAAAYCGVG